MALENHIHCEGCGKEPADGMTCGWLMGRHLDPVAGEHCDAAPVYYCPACSPVLIQQLELDCLKCRNGFHNDQLENGQRRWCANATSVGSPCMCRECHQCQMDD